MQLWTPEHARTLLPALAVMLALAAVLRYCLKDKSLPVRMIPIQIVAVLLLLLEIGKQVLSIARGYDLYHLPFHFCSLFIFMLPLMAFYRGKHQQTVYGITAALCMAVVVLMLAYPALIYSAGNIRDFFRGYFDFHTVLFHNLVVFATVLIVFLLPHTPQKRGEGRAIAWFTVVFCTVSALMAQLLQTNFNNFYSCNVPPLEALRLTVQESLGFWPTQILYILIVTVLDIGFVQLAYWLYRLLYRFSAGRSRATT